jgi:hypothetical protein
MRALGVYCGVPNEALRQRTFVMEWKGGENFREEKWGALCSQEGHDGETHGDIAGSGFNLSPTTSPKHAGDAP